LITPSSQTYSSSHAIGCLGVHFTGSANLDVPRSEAVASIFE
jgi:hypothetical protein